MVVVARADGCSDAGSGHGTAGKAMRGTACGGGAGEVVAQGTGTGARVRLGRQ